MSKATVRAYASPTCVLLAFDWEDGANFNDFLGFSIQRDPGYGANGKPDYLFNKLDFVPITRTSKPKTSDEAPIQKFNWWDGGITSKERGATFKYTVTPVRGTGPGDLRLQRSSAATIKVTVPEIMENGVATYFNRAVVSAQSFLKLKGANNLDRQMDWLANGLQGAIPAMLKDREGFDCAIYHLTDQRWVLPVLKAFDGHGSIVYFDRPGTGKNADHASHDGLANLGKKPKFSLHPRSHIRALMHDKFIVSYKNGRESEVLLGSTNFTPEAQTVQANLLHIFQSPQLADLYSARAKLLASDPGMPDTTSGAAWQSVDDVPGSRVRVFFAPESGSKRTFLDTVMEAVASAKSSVLFCMFTASDPPLMQAIFEAGDNKKLIYGLINSIPDPTKPTKSGKPPKSSPISVEIFHRSRTDKLTLSYDYFRPGRTPAGFLPELSTINVSKYSGGKKPPVAVHIHHKFIVVDGDTDSPTIYTGSANFSKSSENANDENLLEIKGNARLAQIYVAEFMRLYNHYRARALWNLYHPVSGAAKTAASSTKKARSTSVGSLVLASTRDGWAKGAYTTGTPAFRARKAKL